MNEPINHDPLDHEELIRMWQENSLTPPIDIAQLTREICAKVEKFDRRILWRNLREYAAGGVLIAWFLWQSFEPSRRMIAIAGIAAVGFVMVYLWLSHRANKPLDPSADARSYQKALLARYDLQIRLLSQVKYWYVLPLYAWVVLVITLVPPRTSWSRPVAFAFATLLCAFVVWLNESYGVRKLRAEREKAESLVQSEDQ